MPLPSRRDAIKTLVFGTAFSRLAGRTNVESLAFEVRDQIEDNGIMKVRITDFPALQNDYGSVRIGTSVIDSTHYPTGVFYPVLINRAPQGKFYALDTSCSHEGCTVPTLDPEAKLIQCLCHGSRYAIDGSLLRGPAGFGLRSFNFTFEDQSLMRIEIPGLTFEVEVQKQAAAIPGRLALNFLSFMHIDYEVRSRSSWSAEPQAVPFSLTPDGPITETIFSGIDDFVTLYVDASKGAGFFEAAMRAKVV